ncbi:hypothetical protein KIPB_014801, partial [Kipferlia bialata]|eukprot:g14801.t1
MNSLHSSAPCRVEDVEEAVEAKFGQNFMYSSAPARLYFPHPAAETNNTKGVQEALKRFPTVLDVGDETGLLLPTELAVSNIPEAGLGRFIKVDVKKGEMVRVQNVGVGSLLAFGDMEELKDYMEEEGVDVQHMEWFGHAGPQDNEETKGLLLLNDPPCYCNHGSAEDATMMTVYTGGQ